MQEDPVVGDERHEEAEHGAHEELRGVASKHLTFPGAQKGKKGSAVWTARGDGQEGSELTSTLPVWTVRRRSLHETDGASRNRKLANAQSEPLFRMIFGNNPSKHAPLETLRRRSRKLQSLCRSSLGGESSGHPAGARRLGAGIAGELDRCPSAVPEGPARRLGDV